MRRPVCQVLAMASAARSSALVLAALRYCRKAATALSTTFTSTSLVLSSASTLRWMKGTPSLTLPASLSLKSARPS